MEMVVGLASFRAEWPNKHSRTERRRDGSIFLDGFRVIEKSVANAIHVGSCSPGVNAFRASNLMRGRPVASVCTDENRRIDFAAKILKESRKQNNCARHIMRKLP